MNLKKIVALPLHELERRPGGVIASPVTVVAISVGEEVVRLLSPNFVCLVDGIQVARRRRVQKVHFASSGLFRVHVSNKF